MGRRCAIKECITNTSGLRQTIHSFPTSNPFLRQRWIEFLRLASQNAPENLNLEHVGLCTLHFSPEAFYGSTSFDDGKLKLKKTAVPVKLTGTPSISKSFIHSKGKEWDHTYAKSFQNELDRLQQLESNGINWIIDEQDRKLKEKDNLIRTLRNKVHYLNKKCDLLEEKNSKILKTKSDHENDLILQVKSIFSSGQLRMLSNPKLNYIHWSSEDKAKAIALHSVSSRAYEYLRNSCKYPLPSNTTIMRTLQEAEVLPDTVIEVVLHILKEKLRNATPMERVCGLAIDEMSIDNRFCYDSNEDQVLGGSKSVTVVTVRSLFLEWKQVIYFSFQSSISVASIMGIIEKLYAVNVEIVSVTTDMGTKNQGMWKDLQVGQFKNGVPENVSFAHPCSSKEVFVFPDLPHLIKCLRNHILDNGISLENGTVLDREIFEELINRQKAEFKLTHELTHKHLNLKNKQRQEVRPAFQLLSHKVSTAIRLMNPSSPKHQTLADTVDLINNFCDLSNTRTSEMSHNPYKSPYGLQIKEQAELYEKAVSLFATMKVGRRKNFFAPFQKGLIFYINSLKGLYSRLSQENVRSRYLMTAKLNQDLLENVFSRLRGLGQFDTNPNAIQVSRRIKRLLVSWNFLDSLRTSVEFEAEECSAESSLSFLEVTRQKKNTQVFDSQREEFDSISQEVDHLTLRKDDYSFEQFSEEGGLEYVSGYLAHKLLDKFPELSQKGIGEIREAFWVGEISNGGLIEPSLYWHGLVRKFEEFFDIMHKESISHSKDVCKTLCDVIMSRFPMVHSDIIKFYVRTRTFLRISHLNRKMQDNFFKRQGHRSGHGIIEESDDALLSNRTQNIYEVLESFSINALN